MIFVTQMQSIALKKKGVLIHKASLFETWFEESIFEVSNQDGRLSYRSDQVID